MQRKFCKDQFELLGKILTELQDDVTVTFSETDIALLKNHFPEKEIYQMGSSEYDDDKSEIENSHTKIESLVCIKFNKQLLKLAFLLKNQFKKKFTHFIIMDGQVWCRSDEKERIKGEIKNIDKREYRDRKDPKFVLLDLSERLVIALEQKSITKIFYRNTIYLLWNRISTKPRDIDKCLNEFRLIKHFRSSFVRDQKLQEQFKKKVQQMGNNISKLSDSLTRGIQVCKWFTIIIRQTHRDFTSSMEEKFIFKEYLPVRLYIYQKDEKFILFDNLKYIYDYMNNLKVNNNFQLQILQYFQSHKTQHLKEKLAKLDVQIQQTKLIKVKSTEEDRNSVLLCEVIKVLIEQIDKNEKKSSRIEPIQGNKANILGHSRQPDNFRSQLFKEDDKLSKEEEKQSILQEAKFFKILQIDQ